jgi:hypothetical protein
MTDRGLVEPCPLDGRGDRHSHVEMHHRNVIVEVDLEHMVEFGDAGPLHPHRPLGVGRPIPRTPRTAFSSRRHRTAASASGMWTGRRTPVG